MSAHSEPKKEARAENADAEKPPAKPKIWKVVLGFLMDLVRGLWAADRPTRRMSAFFFLSLAGIFVVLSYGLDHWSQNRFERKKAEAYAKAHEPPNPAVLRQKEEARHKSAQFSLGTFTIELKPLTEQKPAREAIHYADVELFAQCDGEETREYLETHKVQARGTVSGLFSAMDRAELMNKEGKKRLRKMVAEQLNLWLPHHQGIEEIFITKLVVN